MNETKKLTTQKCKPCEGMGYPFSRLEAEDYLKAVPEWQLDKEGKGISRCTSMKNFMAAVTLINQIAEIADSENHHPDIHLTGYRKLQINLSTHAIGGLSENDFILAAKINQLPVC